METVLEINNLTKKYGKQYALNDVSFKVKKGAIVGLVGKNGAGKTTLMRLVTGLQNPTSGSYTIMGVSSSDSKISKQRRKCGALIEKPGIYFDLTAKQNMKIHFMNLGIPDYSQIDKILCDVGLDGTSKKLAGSFSLGMKQRLGIALALAGNPDILILDEPINGLDPQGIVEIREILLNLNKNRGTTILISSHILGELEHLATDYVFINKGEVVQQITTEELNLRLRKSTVLTVNHVDGLLKVLDDLGIEYQVTEKNQVNVYGEFEFSEVVINAHKAGVEILKATETSENLERYFLDIVGDR